MPFRILEFRQDRQIRATVTAAITGWIPLFIALITLSTRWNSLWPSA